MYRVGDDIRTCLEEVDTSRIRALWAHVFPRLPQPDTDHHALIAIHIARTRTESVRLEKRLYSHAWLRERGYPSDLPHDLRPEGAMETIVMPAVGVAVATVSSNPDRIEEARAIEKVMARAAGDCVRDGITDRARIAPIMWQRRRDFLAGRLKREI